MSALRSGPPGAFAAPPMATTAVRARTAPAGVRASTPSGEPCEAAHRRVLVDLRPRPRAAARAGRTPGAPAAPSPHRGRRRHRGKPARHSGRRPRRGSAAWRSPRPAHGTPPAARPRFCPEQAPSTPAGNRLRRNQASTPSSSQKASTPSIASRAARATASAASSPHRRRMFGSENHISCKTPRCAHSAPAHKHPPPATPPEPPAPASSAAKQPTARCTHRRPQHISAPLPNKLRRKLDPPRLLQPVPVSVVLHGEECRREGEASLASGSVRYLEGQSRRLSRRRPPGRDTSTSP